MIHKRVQTISFFVILLAVLILVLLVLKPFVNIIALAVILAILFNPVYRWLGGKVKSNNLAALLTVLVVLVILLIPLFFFGQVIFNEASSLYSRVRSGDLVINRGQILQSLPIPVQNFIETFSRDLNVYVQRITSNAFQGFSSLVSNVTSFFIAVFIMFFALFYLLRDGDRIMRGLMDISPIATSQENILSDRIVSAVNGVVKGSFLTALTQGVVATIGFFIFGVPEPIIWGLFTIVAALVPTVGTSLAIIPAVIYLIVTGNIPQAIGMAIWGFLAVGLIDNFIGPKVVGSSVKLHPLLVLLAVLGGIQFFGFLGFLLGPILMAIFMALVNMYRTDFKEYIQQ